MLTAPRHYGQQIGLVCNLKGALVRVIGNHSDHSSRPSLIPKPMPVMNNHSLKRKLYVFFDHPFLPLVPLTFPATVTPR
jgi:hypothetical protein